MNLVWDFKTDIDKIVTRRFTRRLFKFVDIFVRVLTFVFLTLFIYEIYRNIYGRGFSWTLVSEAGMYFDLIIFSLMFSRYRRLRREEVSIKIKSDLSNKEKINVVKYLDEDALVVIETAYSLARRQQTSFSNIHLLQALLADKTAQFFFIRLGVNYRILEEGLEPHLEKMGQGDLGFSPESIATIFKAFNLSIEKKRLALGVLELLWAVSFDEGLAGDFLAEFALSSNKADNGYKWFLINDQIEEKYKRYHRLAGLKPGGAMNRSYTAIATPTLNSFSRDLTISAKNGHFGLCVTRDKEIKEVFDSISSGHRGVLLVGQTGTGKHAIIEGIAQMMVEENVIEQLKDRRLVEIDVPALLGGAGPAEAQNRLLTIISEVLRAGNIILFISSLEDVMGLRSGDEGGLELSEILAEAVENKGLICLATASHENYSKYIEGRKLGDIFSTVGVAEPEFDQAIQILESRVGYLENRYKVFCDYTALEQAINLSQRYISDHFLPEKAIKILETAANKVGGKSKEVALCSREDVAAVISEITGVPLSKLTESEGEKLLKLEDSIHHRLIGQNEAVSAVSAALRRSRAQVQEGKRPIASFLFLGPTGVGKTELTKAVSDIYFGDEKAMIRIDMSEYQLQDSVNKMIGDNEGVLGYLTEQVRKKPFSLILFDEIEKAHPDILNLFLQMLDDGRLTDGQGRIINFTNSIIIATSNIGAVFIQEAVKNGAEEAVIKQELIDNQLNKHLRPELINRFDGIIVFKPLTENDIAAIAKLLLEKIRKNLDQKGINFLASENGIRVLAMAGYDPKFGARPMRRLLQDRLENKIADWIISGELKRRDMVVINEQGEVLLEKAKVL